MYRTLLVPLDGSTFAEDALPLAKLLAHELGAELHLAHVVQAVYGEDVQWLGQARDGTRSYLEEHASQADKEDVSALTAVLEGRIAPALTEYIREQDVDLVVLTSHGRGGVARWWLGSVADSLLRMADADLLLVRPWDETDDRPEGAPRFERILVPLDGSEAAESALAPARALAEHFGAAMTLARVVPKPAELTSIYGVPGVKLAGEGHRERTEDARSYLASVAEGSEGIDVDARVVEDAAEADGIVAAAQELDADLIVLSSHARGGVERAVLGSVADKVIRRATCPVLVIRRGGHSGEPSP